MKEARSSELVAAMTRALQEGSCVVLVTLVQSRTGVGARLLVGESGGVLGSVLGSLGDPALDEAAADYAAAFLGSGAEVKTVRAEEVSDRLPSPATMRLMFERIEPEPQLVICGAGHVGAALARLARQLNYRVTLIDDRPDFITRAQFPETEVGLVQASDWQAAVRGAIGRGRNVAVAIVTRGHAQDEECLRAAVPARPDYLGLIGSRRRTKIVLDRLRSEGMDEERLKAVRAPIGLDIGAVSPEEVALAVLAEVVAHRRGGTGARLSAARRDRSPDPG